MSEETPTQEEIIKGMKGWSNELKKNAGFILASRRERQLPEMSADEWQQWSLPFGGGAGV